MKTGSLNYPFVDDFFENPCVQLKSKESGEIRHSISQIVAEHNRKFGMAGGR